MGRRPETLIGGRPVTFLHREETDPCVVSSEEPAFGKQVIQPIIPLPAIPTVPGWYLQVMGCSFAGHGDASVFLEYC